VLLLLFTGTIDSFVRFAWLTVFLALAGFGVVALRRQTANEFPDAEPPPIADWLQEHMSSLGGRARSAADARTAARESAPDVAPVATPDERPAAPADDLDRLERLADMHARGVLTDEEFAAMKARIVGG